MVHHGGTVRLGAVGCLHDGEDSAVRARDQRQVTRAARIARQRRVVAAVRHDEIRHAVAVRVVDDSGREEVERERSRCHRIARIAPEERTVLPAERAQHALAPTHDHVRHAVAVQAREAWRGEGIARTRHLPEHLVVRAGDGHDVAGDLRFAVEHPAATGRGDHPVHSGAENDVRHTVTREVDETRRRSRHQRPLDGREDEPETRRRHTTRPIAAREQHHARQE